MATRARIGIQVGEEIKSVYNHFDGYPSFLGRQLQQRYGDQSSALALIEGGDISYIGTSTVSYYSEGGENSPAETHRNLHAYLQTCRECCAQYGYLFVNGVWTYYTVSRGYTDF